MQAVSGMMDVGEKIRSLRQQAGWTLQELAKKTGLGLGTLSRLENGKGGHTVDTHLKIATAFGISLAELYHDTQPVGGASGMVERAPQEAEHFTYDAKTSAVLLTTQVLQKTMLPQLLLLEPGGATHVEQTKPGCEKFLFVVEGTVEVEVGDQTYALNRYGTLYFKASVPHSLRNPGKETAKCLSVTSPVGL